VPEGGLLGRLRGIPLRRLELAGLAALLLGAVVLFAIYPAYPSYDSAYALVWGRELVHLDPISLEAFRAPTEHPLAIGVGAVLSLLGESADRTLELLYMLSFVALVAGTYRLARAAFTPLVGLAAALVMLSRFDFASLAIRAFIDIPYLAALVWAAALECERPRRGGVVWVLLVLAGLMRPEAWGLAALYWLWMVLGPKASVVSRHSPGSRPSRRDVLRWTGWALLAPVIWLGFDLIVTGDPLFSFTSTSEEVSELGRNEAISELPSAAQSFLTELVKTPVLLGGALGALLAVWFVPRRAVMPLVLLAAGLATFAAIGAAGLAVIDRYLLLAAAALCVFAGYAAAGFTTLRTGSGLRRAWAAVAAIAVLGVAAYTATHTLNARNFADELAFRTDAHDDLVAIFDDPRVESAIDRGCGPVSTPTNKLVPEVRWVLDRPESEVVARSDPAQRGRVGRGLAIYVRSRRGLQLQGFDPDTSPITQVPAPGFEPLAANRYYALYARCRGSSHARAARTIG
jgi:hypothetical protein